MAKTGIFWIYQGKLIAKTCEEGNSVSSVGGLLDSPDNHADFWESHVQYSKLFPELADKEYFQVPRGRVLLMQADTKAIIYLDRKLMHNKYKTLIRHGFELEGAPVSWRRDAHYTTDAASVDFL